METADIKEFVAAVLVTHEKHQGCYFWKSGGPAHQRRAHENKHSRSASFEFQGVKYSVNQDVTCSCKNVYYSLTVRVNGASKDVRAIKKLNSLLNIS